MRKDNQMKKFLSYGFYFTCLAAVVFSCMSTLQAQDVHFSQFSYTPLQVNPALTGIFDGKARVSNSYRSQWSGFGNGYKTIHVSADAAIGKETMKNKYFGIGGMVYQDKAGEAGFRSTIIEGSLSFTSAFSDQEDHFFSLGFQAGLNQQSVDLTKASWDSQWNGDSHDPSLPSGESIQLNEFTYLDFNAGVLYYYIPDGINSFSAGVSLSHIGNPNVSYYINSETPLRSKLTIHSTAEISIDKYDEMWVTPKVLALMQGEQKEYLFGGSFKNKVQFKSRYTNYKKEAYFYGGLYYRWDDAVVVNARFEFNTLGLGLSYDINTSNLSKLAGSANAFEINLTFVSYVKKGNRSKNVNKMPRYF
jgi:type IX secretion system PorP/SprF family membrane protein